MIDFFTNTANSTNSFFINTFTPTQPLITTTISNNIPAYAPTRIFNDYQIITPDILDRGMFNDFQVSAPLQAQFEPPIQTLNTQVFQPLDISRPKTLSELNIPQISTPQIIPAYIYEPINVNPPPPNIINNYTPSVIFDDSKIMNNLKNVNTTLTNSLQNLNNNIAQQQYNTNQTLNDTITRTDTLSSNISTISTNLTNQINNVNLSLQNVQTDFKKTLIENDQISKNIIETNKNETEKQFNLLNSNINKLVIENQEINNNLINYKIASNVNRQQSNNNFTEFTTTQQNNNNNIALILFIPILAILLKNV